MRRPFAPVMTLALVMGGILLVTQSAYTHGLVKSCPTPMPPQFTIAEDHTSDQWYLAQINAPKAWQITTGSRDVIVAVIDTGVDYNHPDLAPNIWVNSDEIPDDNEDNDLSGKPDDCYGWDFVDDDPDPLPENVHSKNDPDGHGTAVAGIIGAVHGNGGIDGINAQVQLMPLRAYPGQYAMRDFDCDDGYAGNIAEAIRYAVKNDASVIVLSIGMQPILASKLYGCIYDAILYAQGKGRVVVAGSGNDNKEQVAFPASMKPVIAVGATDRDDHRLVDRNNPKKGSSYGDELDVMAPGLDIWTTVPFAQYEKLHGTSFAAPQVAGLAALLLSADPELDSEAVRDYINLRARKVGGYNYELGRHIEMGWGLIDAHEALCGAIHPVLVVDDADRYFKRSGTPEWWYSLDDGYGDGAMWTKNEADRVDNKARWEADALCEAGSYQVQAYIPRRSAKLPELTRSAIYTIMHAGAETSVVMDQASASGSWLDLGVFYFGRNGDGKEYVELIDKTGEQPAYSTAVVYDAIRWVKTDDSTEPFDASAAGGIIYDIVVSGETAELEFIVQNTGLAPWAGPSFALVGDPGNPEGAPKSLALGDYEQVQPGETISRTVQIPVSDGTPMRQVRYQMNRDAKPFGEVITGYVFVLPEQLKDIEDRLRKQIDEWLSEGKKTAEEIAQKIVEAIQREIERQVRNLLEELLAPCQAQAALLVLAPMFAYFRSRRRRN